MSPLWLKSLPWSTILSNAPLIVESAKKLATLVKSKPTDEAIWHDAGTFDGDPQLQLSALRVRIRRLEDELQQSAELVRTLAENQTRMAQVLEALRRRARLHLRITVTSLIGVAMLLFWALTR